MRLLIQQDNVSVKEASSERMLRLIAKDRIETDVAPVLKSAQDLSILRSG